MSKTYLVNFILQTKCPTHYRVKRHRDIYIKKKFETGHSAIKFWIAHCFFSSFITFIYMLTCKDPFISSKAVSSLHQINKTTKTNDICFTKVLFFENKFFNIKSITLCIKVEWARTMKCLIYKQFLKRFTFPFFAFVRRALSLPLWLFCVLCSAFACIHRSQSVHRSLSVQSPLSFGTLRLQDRYLDLGTKTIYRGTCMYWFNLLKWRFLYWTEQQRISWNLKPKFKKNYLPSTRSKKNRSKSVL